MSKVIVRLLAVSAIAAGSAFVGFHQAQAFTFAPSFLLSQASGGAGPGGGTAGSSGGGPGAQGSGSAGAKGSAGSSTGAANQPAPGSTTPGAATPPAATSPSQGVPAACAAITSASERAACIQRQAK